MPQETLVDWWMDPYRQQNNRATHVLLSGQSGKAARRRGALASEHTGGAWPVAALRQSVRGREMEPVAGPHRSHLSLLFRHGSQLRILRERLVKGAWS